jgi:hypothetical protein
MISKTNIFLLINESKFLPEEHLLTLLKSIIKITEGYNHTHLASNQTPANAHAGHSAPGHELVDFVHEHHALSANITSTNSSTASNTHGSSLAQADHISTYSLLFDTKTLITPSHIHTYTTASSYAWLEMLLIEIALRNRDRFQICWPLLRSHYQRCLSQNVFSKLSYVTER